MSVHTCPKSRPLRSRLMEFHLPEFDFDEDKYRTNFLLKYLNTIFHSIAYGSYIFLPKLWGGPRLSAPNLHAFQAESPAAPIIIHVIAKYDISQ